jgi:hypothetical protein
MTSHKVRQPIANDGSKRITRPSKDSKLSYTDYIKTSAQSLDVLTKRLNAYIMELRQKAQTRGF